MFFRWDINEIDHLQENLKQLYQLYYEIVEGERLHLEKEGTAENIDHGINEVRAIFNILIFLFYIL